MSCLVAFPKNIPRKVIYTSAGSSIQSGPGTFVDVSSVYNPGRGRFAIIGWVAEFLAVASGADPFVIGDGTTQLVGLYGKRKTGEVLLLGVFGLNIGNKLPQIPMLPPAGWAQEMNQIGLYQSVTVGSCLGGDIAVGSDITVAVSPVLAYNT